MGSSKDTITQLNSARDIVLRDPAIYPQVVPGVLPVISSSQPLELRRWGADFLAETFASPVVTAEEKGKMCLAVLDTLKGYLNREEEAGVGEEEEDASVLKSAVQCAASVYPLVLRHVIAEADGGKEGASLGGKEVWSKMTGLKAAILRRLDSASVGVRICCIKFVARVVQVQTPGLIADPRKPDQNEISLALVPREHAILVPSTLEAEASGLLDRLLSVFQDSASDAIIVTATLNALSPLVHRRASIATRILSTILAFNPIRDTNTTTTTTTTTTSAVEKVGTKSMTRTTITFLTNLLKRSPTHPLLARIHTQIDRLRHLLAENFSDGQHHPHNNHHPPTTNGLKRGLPDEEGAIDAFYPSKRLQLDAEIEAGLTPQQQQEQQQQQQQGRTTSGPLPPGPVSYKDLYTLGAADPRAAGFHVEVLPPQIVAQLVPPLLQAVEDGRFHLALNAVRARVLELQRRPAESFSGSGGVHLDVEEDEEEEYDPSAVGFGVEPSSSFSSSQMQMQTDPRMLVAGAGVGMQQQQRIMPVVEEAIRFPPEPPLSAEERVEYAEQVRERLFGTLREVDEEIAKRKGEGGEKKGGMEGFQRAVVSANSGAGQDREGWITLLIRLATRTSWRDGEGREEEEEEEEGKVKPEGEEWSLVKKGLRDDDLPSKIRAALNRYIMDDWRRRIDVAIAWLNEEWYADRIASSTSTSKTKTKSKSAHENQPSTSQEAEPAPEANDNNDNDFLPNYTPLTLSLLDQLLPYLDTKDGRHLIRFLSEIPHLPREIFSRVAKIAEDPERVQISTQVLLYLIMLRPPVRESAIECAVAMWKGNPDARVAVEKVLRRWRPGVLVEEDGKGEGDEGSGGGGGEMKVEGAG